MFHLSRPRNQNALISTLHVYVSIVQMLKKLALDSLDNYRNMTILGKLKLKLCTLDTFEHLLHDDLYEADCTLS